MKLKIGLWLLAAAAVSGGGAIAADRPDYPDARFPRAERSRPVVLHPDCKDVNTRLLSCRPHVYVNPEDPGVVRIIDGPPAAYVRPYPEIFSW